MNIGHMRHRITLFKPIVTEDVYGGQRTDPESAGQVWAELFQTNYREQQAQGAPMAREQLRFRIRKHREVDRGWSIEYNGQQYLIEVVDNTYSDSTTIIVHAFNAGV